MPVGALAHVYVGGCARACVCVCVSADSTVHCLFFCSIQIRMFFKPSVGWPPRMNYITRLTSTWLHRASFITRTDLINGTGRDLYMRPWSCRTEGTRRYDKHRTCMFPDYQIWLRRLFLINFRKMINRRIFTIVIILIMNVVLPINVSLKLTSPNVEIKLSKETW